MNLIGIDVGSTTVKVAIIVDDKIVYKNYVRHFSKVKECVLLELKELLKKFGNIPCRVAMTGSAGLGLAERANISFVQEVQAAFTSIKKFYHDVDVAIELGGEDAKIIFVTGGTEQRMNGSCAGGTGAFIDQMATLLNISVEEMDKLALRADKIYPIASRCGVFAKSDIQPLINQGCKKEDISASIFQAVVDQTISGLAQGRKIKGKVLFLGGPLYFNKGLRKAFTNTLCLTDENAIFPDNAPNFISIGAALYAENSKDEFLVDVLERITKSNVSEGVSFVEPLFNNNGEYEKFILRHSKNDVKFADINSYVGDAYLGIDSGSTTTKIVLITDDCKLLYSYYNSNNGQPLDIIVEKLKEMLRLSGDRINIKGSAVTGYGEDLIRNALRLDFGVVETVAHFKTALFFNPNVDFIIDIGGQDIKCFKVKNNSIDNIMLNEACSSGCGSFIETFAKAMGMGIEDFSRKGLFSKRPVDLGSRCTVFMNSAVKQAQKEGATVEDISAGLSISIVKNAIYKVIRAKSPEELGKNIVVQGGTFLNDAVLRSFEKEIGREVTRPAIAGLMGAFGAAIYAKENISITQHTSNFLSLSELEKFSYNFKATNCKGCTSRCNINIVFFSDGRRYISGNKCEKGAGQKVADESMDIYAYKHKLLYGYESCKNKDCVATVGLPMQLVMYDQLPFWSKFFTDIGFNVVLGEKSSRELYFKGQHTVASDTACYPAKLMHGHIESLLDCGVDFIFYPNESYNFDERGSTNHYNCPVVAYYSELLKANNERLNENNFIMPYLDLNNEKAAINVLYKSLNRYKIKKSKIKNAFINAINSLNNYKMQVEKKCNDILREARREGKEIIVILGRPYHADYEINHGITKLLSSLGFAVISEDGVYGKIGDVKVNVLNQWTFHSRMYKAAAFAIDNPDVHVLQLVSFGCGIDAITSDEIRSICENNGKLYTQIKIDEINNLGVVKIRLRSLAAAIEERKNSIKEVACGEV